MKKMLLIGHVISLITGGTIYITLRNNSLEMFNWFDILRLTEVINSIRKITFKYSVVLPDWFKFSFPDGLWVYSYVSIMLLIWKGNTSKISILFVLILPIVAVLSEIGQLIKLIPGTFDTMDLLFYILGTILPFLFFKNSPRLNSQTI